MFNTSSSFLWELQYVAELAEGSACHDSIAYGELVKHDVIYGARRGTRIVRIIRVMAIEKVVRESHVGILDDPHQFPL